MKLGSGWTGPWGRALGAGQIKLARATCRGGGRAGGGGGDAHSTLASGTPWGSILLVTDGRKKTWQVYKPYSGNRPLPTDVKRTESLFLVCRLLLPCRLLQNSQKTGTYIKSRTGFEAESSSHNSFKIQCEDSRGLQAAAGILEKSMTP